MAISLGGIPHFQTYPSLSQVFMMHRGATFISHLVEGPDTLRAVPGFTARFASNPGGPVARDMQEGMR